MQNAKNQHKISRWLGLLIAIVVLGAAPVTDGLARARAAPLATTGTGAGLLDPAYGMSGKTIGAGLGQLTGLAGFGVQPNGDYIVSSTTNGKLLLAAFRPDGSLDSAFGDGGRVSFGMDPMPNQNKAMAIQPDGKIVVVGTQYAEPSLFWSPVQVVVVRFNADGSLDHDFATDGVYNTLAGGEFYIAAAVAVQADGTLLVGWAEQLIRLTASGVLDTRFGSHDFGGSTILAQPDGKYIIRAGNTLRRFNNDGSRDTTFSSGASGGDAFSADSAPVISADGKIAIAGTYQVRSGDTTRDDFGLARLNADGSPDLSLNATGFVSTDLGGQDEAHALAMLPDGRTVVAGASDGKFALVRYLLDGQLDPTFGTLGQLTTAFDAAAAIGAIVRADATLTGVGTVGNSFALARYDLRGALVAGFGVAGKIVALMPTTLRANTRMVIQPSGKIVTANIERRRVVVSRFDAVGQADTSFAGGGVQTLDVGLPSWDLDGTAPSASLAALAVQANGNVVIQGASHDQEIESSASFEYGDMVLWRDDPDGGLNMERVGGLVGLHAGALAVGVQPNGKILAVGRAFVHDCIRFEGCNDAETFGLARFAVDGASDGDFHGIADPALGGTRQLVGQGDDKALVLVDDAIRRYDAHGQLDATFGAGGILAPGVPVAAMISLPDGKLLTAGSDGEFALARFMPDGSRDSSFGDGGVSRVRFDGADVVTALALQADGKIVTAGYRNDDFTIARFMPDGALDHSFGADGLVSTDFGGSDRATNVAVTPDGKIVVAGFSDGRPAFARYLGASCNPDFIDVSADDYYRVPVQYLYCHSIISGYADGSFGPANTTTRAQLAKIVVLAQGWTLLNPTAPTFSDVPATSPFYRFVETAARAGLINGYADGTFRPGANITRAQLSKIIALARGWPLITPQQPSFRDVDVTNPFYSFIETAYANRVLSGYELADGGREFRWGASATRGQVAKIVYNAIGAAAPTQAPGSEKAQPTSPAKP